MRLPMVPAAFAKFAGLVLVAAGCLKGYDLLTSVALPDHRAWDTPFLQAVHSALEVIFGLWLFVCPYSTRSKILAVSCFSVLLLASLVKAVSGAKSCGCFGPIEINPWITAAFDAIALAFLLSWQQPSRPQVPARIPLRVAYCVPLLFLLGMAAGLRGYRFPLSFLANGAKGGEEGRGIFEPWRWYGSDLPLLDHTDAGQTLRHGLWVIMLRRSTCQHCQQVLDRYLQLAAQDGQGVGDPRFGILDLTDADDEAVITSKEGSFLVAHLTGETPLAVQTPMFLVVEDGVLRRAETSIEMLELLYNQTTLW